ncbi:hypothetical protein AVEN_103400-1 [Araneus ventricosus]|uniref:Uncharacterized protein n=1 Tax=Araneus ventricosus TaxID=182803 RepID=A0A4Y2K2G5_ARAVE|nr:hypothetical protein AVEN_103400-1 [Araneus ventricosus]
MGLWRNRARNIRTSHCEAENLSVGYGHREGESEISLRNLISAPMRGPRELATLIPAFSHGKPTDPLWSRRRHLLHWKYNYWLDFLTKLSLPASKSESFLHSAPPLSREVAAASGGSTGLGTVVAGALGTTKSTGF